MCYRRACKKLYKGMLHLKSCRLLDVHADAVILLTHSSSSSGNSSSTKPLSFLAPPIIHIVVGLARSRKAMKEQSEHAMRKRIINQGETALILAWRSTPS